MSTITNVRALTQTLSALTGLKLQVNVNSPGDGATRYTIVTLDAQDRECRTLVSAVGTKQAVTQLNAMLDLYWQLREANENHA